MSSRIDLWHYKYKTEKIRDEVVGYLTKQFLILFQDALMVPNINEIMSNRMELYGVLLREKGIEEIYDHLLQLVYRTKDGNMPRVYDYNNFPALIFDALERIMLTAKILSFDEGIVQACLRNVENYYDLIKENE